MRQGLSRAAKENIMRCSFGLLLAAASMLLVAAQARAQEPATKPAQPPKASSTAEQKLAQPPIVMPPAAIPADVATPDAIIAATYDVISGPAGKRDWNRFRSLFVPGARLIYGGPLPPKLAIPPVVDPDGYIAQATPYFEKNGFFEREIARRSDRYGNIMELFSTYESRNKADDSKPFARGINSFQLFTDGHRWWVVTIYWQEESPSVPLPKEFLSTPKE
jgi:hypothetical protein